jgi:hypothetical protein
MKMKMQILFQIEFPVLKYIQKYVTFKSLIFFVIYEKSNSFALKSARRK